MNKLGFSTSRYPNFPQIEQVQKAIQRRRDDIKWRYWHTKNSIEVKNTRNHIQRGETFWESFLTEERQTPKSERNLPLKNPEVQESYNFKPTSQPRNLKYHI